MTEEELDKLIELKKTQAKAIEFDRTEEEFVEEFFRKLSEHLTEEAIDKPIIKLFYHLY